MINIRALSNARKNQKRYDDLIKLEKEALNAPLSSISPRENEKIIKIDKYIFTTFTNIASLDTILELGVSKIACISKNYYLKIGANEERISFEATIFIEHLEHFNGLIDKIKACKPLSLSTLESTQMRHILIDTFSSKTQSWQLDSMRNLTYHTKVFNISGVVL